MKNIFFVMLFYSIIIHSMEMEIERARPRITVINPEYKTVINFLNDLRIQIQQYKKNTDELFNENAIQSKKAIKELSIDFGRRFKDSKFYFKTNFVFIPERAPLKNGQTLSLNFFDTSRYQREAALEIEYDGEVHKLIVHGNEKITETLEKPLKELYIEYEDDGSIGYSFE